MQNRKQTKQSHAKGSTCCTWPALCDWHHKQHMDRLLAWERELARQGRLQAALDMMLASLTGKSGSGSTSDSGS